MAGRGRLSSIDLLPEEAEPDIRWASAELMKRERSQADILFELNDRLEVIGCEPVSRSAFNRYSTRKAALTRRLDEMNRVAEAVAKVVGNDEADRSTIMLIQLIKQAVLEILEKGNIGSKEVLDLSRALSAAQNAQRASAHDRRAHKNEKLKDEQRKQMDVAAQTATEEIVEANPHLDPANVLSMIRGAYGIEDG